MEVDGPLVVHAVNGRICHIDICILNHFPGESCLPVAVAALFKTYSPGSGVYGEVKELERLV